MQLIGERGRHLAARAQEAVGDRTALARKRRDGGERGQLLQPVLAVPREPLGTPVPEIVLDKVAQRAQAAGRAVLPQFDRRVNFADPLQEKGEPEAVHHDVVRADVEQGPVIGQDEHGEVEQGSAHEVGWPTQVRLHLRQRLRPRVQRTPQVYYRQRPVAQLLDYLPGALGIGLEPNAEGIGVRHRPAHRDLEQPQVDGALDVQAFGGGVDRILRVCLLSQPNRGLRGGERQAIKTTRHVSP